MGRPVKLTDRNKPWARKRIACRERRVDIREERQRILIVCEGEKTEPNYFTVLGQQLPRNVVKLHISGEGASTISLVSRAKEIRDRAVASEYPFDQVWIVFDRDSFRPDDFDNAIHMAEADRMQCAWSNEAFELWYVLHFEFRNTAMSRTEYQGKLSHLLGEVYRKNDPDMFKKLSNLGQQSQAIAWAEQLYSELKSAGIPPSQSNPCSAVFLLVKELNRFLLPNQPDMDALDEG